MKKIVSILAMASIVAAVTSCVEKLGQETGTDSNAAVTVYTSAPGAGYNVDNDLLLNISVNNKVVSVYCYKDSKEGIQQKLSSLGEQGLADFVVENGETVECGVNTFDGAANGSKILTDMFGATQIVVVGIPESGAKAVRIIDFFGLKWNDVVTGEYTFANSYVQMLLGETSQTTLQVCDSDSNRYRFKDVFGIGKHLQLTKTNIVFPIDDEEVTIFRIPDQETNVVFGANGPVRVRDIGYWQGDDSFVTDGGSLSVYLYTKSSSKLYCGYICVQYRCDAGNMGYGPDSFTPAE